jgi:tetraacyldisaccharide 4'-kinase
VAVFVCENRSFGVAKIREKYQGPIILDDGFQHRKVKAGLSIVLTEYNRLFTGDYMMPYGRLREFSSGVKRADYLIVSKCPDNISYSEKLRISGVLPFNKNRIYFSVGKSIDYLIKHVLLVTGIANPKPLYAYLTPNYKVDSISFLDHHLFTISDIKKIHSKFESLKKEGGILLTTEKDYMRLLEFKDLLKNFPWFFIPIDIKLDNEAQFKKEIISYVTRV